MSTASTTEETVSAFSELVERAYAMGMRHMRERYQVILKRLLSSDLEKQIEALINEMEQKGSK